MTKTKTKITEQNEAIKSSKNSWNQFDRWGQVYGGKDLYVTNYRV